MARTSIRLTILLCLSVTSKYSEGLHLEAKIVEGEYVPIHNYPHAVFLEMVNGDSSTHICGASVLNQYYLVSVAHCFNTLDKNGKVKAFAGHENIKKAKVIRSGKPIIHSHFDTYTVENDIALLLLDKPLPLGTHIQRVIIKKNFPQVLTGSVAGWGIINEVTVSKIVSSSETILLKSVTQSLKGRQECMQLDLKPGMFCAGSLKSSDPRPASGDSGSGLVTANYQLIGLVSYKLSMYSALPVYTNVSYYYKWIKHETKSKFCSLKYI